MKFSLLKNIFSTLLLALLLIGCKVGTDPRIADPSDNASILHAYIKASTYSPNASKAFFTIDNVKDSIYNVDSLPYGTKVDSLFLGFRFASSLGYIINDTVPESNIFNDVVTSKAYDLTKPIKIKNLATDDKTFKVYTIEVRVHKVQTYLHVWDRLTPLASAIKTDNQKAVLLNDNFLYYLSDGATVSLFTSADAKNWENKPVNGLPTDANLQNILTYNNTLFLLYNGNTVYLSDNGETWTNSLISGDFDYDYMTLLFSFKDKLWAVAKSKTSNIVKIANSDDGINWIFSDERTFDDSFPVSDFATTAFEPHFGSKKVIVVGGISPSGKKLNSIWTAEDITQSLSLNWLNLYKSNSNLLPTSDVSVAHYGSKLLLFGGSTSTLPIDTTQIRQSINEGMNWILPDTTINRIPEDFIPRTNASLIHHVKDNSLFIIGGRSSLGPLTDVWKIKVNFYNFADYKENPYKY
ncbi:MAG: hypothetical protein GX102_02060 [Porphyromonadaceae bacterium]|nr:hypothetical protein [Porphyromonadaceae bacterium]